MMRDASIAVLREIGVETGGSNVQFAINPEDGRMVVIEMNPRVSRSSALASKATGFPIAKVAARLAVGYTLDELENDITAGAMPAAFEPTIDYVVTKIPRFAFEKFPGAEPVLTTSMKSVGEVMAIGRTFAESLQKALRGLETGLSGLDEIEIPGPRRRRRRERRARRARHAAARPAAHDRAGAPARLRHRADPRSLPHRPVVPARDQDASSTCEARVREHGLPKSAKLLRQLKAAGFSDARLATLSGQSEAEVRALRQALGVLPVFKRVDTCAAEFAAPTAYMYSTYETPFGGAVEDEARPSDKTKVIILGGGPNRIGQGIEFDYCCCHAAFALDEAGFESIMVNCNPETVSTDYDTSDRLYFEPLTAEDVLEIVRVEQSRGKLLGVIVQFGGQTPLKLAAALQAANVPILGTSPDMIDLAEDRERFQELIQRLGLRQPENGTARSAEEARKIVERIGYPVVIRPSYVLGGRAMEIVRDPASLERYMTNAVVVSGTSPVLIDSYLSDAIEVDVDALSDGKDVFVCGVMEHIEEAGIHSGDSACSLPPHSLPRTIIAEIERQTVALAKALQRRRADERAIRGEGRRHLHPRGQSARLAHRALRRQGDRHPDRQDRRQDHGRARSSPTSSSTQPKLEAHLGQGGGVPVRPLPERRHAARAGDEIDRRGDGNRRRLPDRLRQEPDRRRHRCCRPAGPPSCRSRTPTSRASSMPSSACQDLGFRIIATAGTQRFLAGKNIPCDKVNKVLEGRPHIVDAIKNGEVQLVINTTEGAQALADSRSLRREALLHKVPYFTTLAGASAAALGIEALLGGQLEVRPLQSYFTAA